MSTETTTRAEGAKTGTSGRTLFLVETAVLAAIVLLMAFTPIGYIKTGALEITLIVIPVTVGAVVLGPVGGLILGTVFGLTSFIQCFGLSLFGAALLAVNPVATFIVCVPTRMLMGWLTGIIYKAIRKPNENSVAALPVASVCGPLLNTLFFMSTLVICFYRTDYIQGFVQALGAKNPFTFVLLFVGINGLIEAIVGIIVSTAVGKALLVANARAAR